MRIKLPFWAGGLSVLFMASAAVAQPGGFPGGFPGGPPGGFPEPGQILSPAVQDQIKLTAEQKRQLADIQKEVDAKLAALLTEEQKKSLKETRPGGGFGPPGGGFGFGPPGGGFGFGNFGQNSLDDAKKQLGATEEEWRVIGPKLKKVVAARQVLTSVDGGTTFGGGGPPGGGGTNIVSQARADLKAVISDAKHTTVEVDEKVAAVRKARQKAQTDLDAAQKDLQQMLTHDQIAVLVSLGYVE